jgi:serine/threonine protein kinase/tetratricopeptide (TPR) repeat protein
MTADRWRQVEDLFHQALDQPEPDRRAWLDQACAGDNELKSEILSLLASDLESEGKFVGAQVEQAVIAMAAEPSADQKISDRRIGPYKLIRELGRGGMGAVYLAARADDQYESQVAIKLVRPGLDTEFILRRFRRERQILARLQHPHIARMLDGDTTPDGVPYIVMEYVDGGSWITKYAIENDLTVDQRLRLFFPVCAAVAHAHRNFVVHRDLKPGNILINREGAPKLLDFGISKLLHMGAAAASETREVNLMTPDYASPEQIVGDPVTIASDIYSLGAVLYELLTGKRPHVIENCRPLELEKAICHTDTVSPSVAVRPSPALARRLAGDLDNIVLRAMQKSPDRRYASVDEFADDIRRHLEHRPVLARRDSMWYRSGKFFRRNRVAASLTGLAAASLIAGTAISVYQARIAQQRYQQVRKLASTFVFDVDAAARDLPGSMKVRQLIATTGLEYLDNLSRNSARDWDLKRELAAAYQRIADVQGGANTSNLGDPAAALVSYRHAESLLDEVLKHDPSNRKALMDWFNLVAIIGDLQVANGGERAAVDTYSRGMQRLDEALAAGANPDADPELEHAAAVYLFDLARVLRLTGELKASGERVARGIDLAKKAAAAKPDDKEVRSSLSMGYAQLAGDFADRGDLQEAVKQYRLGVAELEALCARFPNDAHARHELMLAYSHVGDTLGNPGFPNLGDIDGARAEYVKMAAVAKSLYEADASDTRAVMDYGISLLRVGLTTTDRDAKLATLRQSEQILTLSVKQNPKHTLAGTHKGWVEEEIGDLLKDRDHAGAIRQYQSAASSSFAVLAVEPASRSGQRRVITALGKLAQEQVHAGQRDQAETNLQKLLQFGRDVKEKSPGSFSYRLTYARAMHTVGDGYSALALAAPARDAYKKTLEELHAIESQPEFAAVHRKEMETVTAALAKLEGNRP